VTGEVHADLMPEADCLMDGERGPDSGKGRTVRLARQLQGFIVQSMQRSLKG
jgi:hypothetical protein